MPLPTKLYLFYLNLWQKRSFLDNMEYMLEYIPSGFARMNIYHLMSGFTRIATHELEQQLGRLLNERWWISGVHKAAGQRMIQWPMNINDSRGQPVVFYSQVDPRTV
jgi:hypothetical protein